VLAVRDLRDNLHFEAKADSDGAGCAGEEAVIVSCAIAEAIAILGPHGGRDDNSIQHTGLDCRTAGSWLEDAIGAGRETETGVGHFGRNKAFRIAVGAGSGDALALCERAPDHGKGMYFTAECDEEHDGVRGREFRC